MGDVQVSGRVIGGMAPAAPATKQDEWPVCDADNQWRPDPKIKGIPVPAITDKCVQLRIPLDADMNQYGLIEATQGGVWPAWMNSKLALMLAYKKTTLNGGDGKDWAENEFHALLLSVFWFTKQWQMFNFIDSSQDRRIDFGEFHVSLSQFGLTMSPAEVAREFKSVDTDGGGMVSFMELCAYIRDRVNLDEKAEFDPDILGGEKSDRAAYNKFNGPAAIPGAGSRDLNFGAMGSSVEAVVAGMKRTRHETLRACGEGATLDHQVRPRAMQDFDTSEDKIKEESKLNSMWRQLDFNGNWVVSLADNLVVENYSLLNHKPAPMRCYKQTKERKDVFDDAIAEHLLACLKSPPQAPGVLWRRVTRAFAEGLGRKTTPIFIRREDTVHSVKTTLCAKLGGEVEDFSCRAYGSVLGDGLRLSDCNISPGTTLRCVRRVRGGGCNSSRQVVPFEAEASASGAVAVAEAVPGATAVVRAAASSSGAVASAEAVAVPAQARPEALIDTFELRPVGKAAFRIKATEDRAITVLQLDALVAYVDRHCAKELWTSSNPKTPDLELKPDSINLYEVVHWVIKPATKKDVCSYVELVATAVQVPKWFVSHWWGEPVKQFVACLRGHRRDRKLPETCAYWVCAYANNQWNAGDEVGDDPANSSFRRAINKSVGTVTVLDEAATTYTRIWCSYEIFVTLKRREESRYLYDVYTTTADLEAIGLTDGCAEVDGGGEYSGWHKRRREKPFLVDLLAKGLKSEVDKAEASEEKDRKHILNSIAGFKDLNAPPPESHEAYDHVNQRLRGRFATKMFDALITERCAKDLTNQILSGMSNSCATEMELDLDDAKDKGFAVELLKSALPDCLNSLKITCRKAEVGSGVGAGLALAIQGMQGLVSLDLDLVASQIGAEGAAALGHAIGGLQSLEELTLDVSDNNFDGDGMALGKAIGSPPHLKKLKLVAKRLQEVDFVAALGQAIDGLQSLEELTLDLSGNNFHGDGRALGKAIGSPPHLKKLNLTAMGLVEVDFAAALGQAIDGLQSLEELPLDLSENLTAMGLIEVDFAAALGQSIDGLQSLEELTLDLSDNNFHGDGRALGKAIGSPQHLKKLTLTATCLEEVGSGVGAGLALAIQGIPGLVSLYIDLENSQLGAEGAAALGQAIGGLQSLEELALNVSRNNFDGDGMALGKAIGSPPHLKKLELVAERLQEAEDSDEDEEDEDEDDVVGEEHEDEDEDEEDEDEDEEDTEDTEDKEHKKDLGDGAGDKVGSGVWTGLAGAIHGLQGLTNLELKLLYNQVGAEGAAALGQAIGSLQSLEELALMVDEGDEGEAEFRKLKEELEARPGRPVAIFLDIC